ncbi:hypothetical protein ACWC2K_20790 [Streptomyces chattanoogensis]|uniref:hypothetical protein n=1 Tax=Streptomyces chattanoogensis TaxID=66876 RepID=UPI00368812EA
MNSAAQASQTEHPEHPDEVLVEVVGCATQDAHAVFSALRESFVSDRSANDVPKEVNGATATVWTVTVDVSELRAEAAPRPLSAPVTVDLQGGYWAVDRLRKALAHAFSVRVVGTAAGDQEKEVQLRLETL